VAAAIAVVLALVAASPASAVTDPGVIAHALERSPVYVDPAFAGAVPEAQRRSLVRVLRDASRPLYVAFVPIIAGDEYGGEARQFLSVLHDRLGRDGVYVTIQDGQLQHREYGAGSEADDAVYEASYVIIGEGPRNEAPVARVKRFVAALADPGLAERYRRARGEPARPSPPAAGGERSGGGDGSGGATLLVVLAGLALALVLGVAVIRRRRGAGYASEPLPVLPRRVFENARAAAEEDLRDQARQAVVDFAAALDPVAPPSEPAAAADYALALDAHSAASRTLDGAHGVPDLVGVLALIDRGYTALAAAQARAAGRPGPPVVPLCLFNPLHGYARREVAWRDGLRVPVCADCAAALRRGEAPDALRDGSQPYLEGDSVWARTGYGAFGDDLVGRVSQGRR
jgi:hypothetical protein